MDITFGITMHFDNPEHQLTEEDVPVVSYACFCIMADAKEVEDENGGLRSFHCDMIAQKFPDYANRTALIYATAISLLEEIKNTFEAVANGKKC